MEVRRTASARRAASLGICDQDYEALSVRPGYEAGPEPASEAEDGGALLHGGEAEGDVGVEIDAEFGCALEDIFAGDAAGEGLVLEFFAHAGGFDIGDLAAGLDQGAGGEKAGEFVAGEEGFVEVGEARDAGVTGVSEDGGAQLGGPAETLQFADADEGMFGERGVALVVEVMQQGRCRVEVEQGCALGTVEGESVSLLRGVGDDAGFDGERMFAQAFAGGPLGEELPGGGAVVVSGRRGRGVFGHGRGPRCCGLWFAFLRVFSGIVGKSLGSVHFST